MSLFRETLVRIKNELGHATTKEFYQALKKRGLSCNYQHFVKIEKGSSFPSSLLVNQIVSGLDKKNGNELILSYCSEMFPSRDFLFPQPRTQATAPPSPQESRPSFATELTPKQIATLASKKEIYHLFLILTLSRTPVKIEDLKFLSNQKKPLQVLEDAGIAIIEDEYIRTISTEYRFPKDSSLDKYYNSLDEWDLIFATDFHFESLLNKVMTRRISPRYLSVINQQIDALVGLVRLSDESDPAFNTEVLQLQIKVKKGDLPG